MAGWVFVGVGSLGAIATFVTPSPAGGAPPVASALMIILLFVVPAAFLISRKTRVPAVIMMVVAGLLVLLGLIVFALSNVKGGAGAGFTGLIPAFWLLLFVLSWRSFRAASALRRLKTGGAATEAAVMVFD